MARDTIADFLVRLGFDGKEVIKGVAKTEAALKRLKKTKVDAIKGPKDEEFKQTVKATRQRIQAEQNVNRMRQTQAAKDARERQKEILHIQQIRAKRRALLRNVNMRQEGRLTPGDREMLKQRIFQTRNKESLKDIGAELRDHAAQNRKTRRSLEKQLTLMNAMKFSMASLVASVKNFARSWMSIFAVGVGAVAGLRFTQEFQALNASMLAVSENSLEAGKNVEFIKNLAKELPIDIRSAGDEFKNLLAAGRESVGTEGIKEVFTGFAEFGAALQVSPQRMSRAMTAVSQVFNKGQLMSEEVKQQIGEQLPGAIQIFAKSLNMSTQEFFKAMENGELLAEDVMPKVAKEMRRVARNNDALAKSLMTSRSQWTLFANNFKLLFDGFGSTQLDRGIAAIIRNMSGWLKVIKPLAQTLFYFLGLVTKLIAAMGTGILTVFQPFLNVFKMLEEPILRVFNLLEKTDEEMVQFFSDIARLAVYLVKPLAIIKLLGIAIEELVNIFTGHAQGIFAGPGETFAERFANSGIVLWWDQFIKFIESKKGQFQSWGMFIGEQIGLGIAAGMKRTFIPEIDKDNGAFKNFIKMFPAFLVNPMASSVGRPTPSSGKGDGSVFAPSIIIEGNADSGVVDGIMDRLEDMFSRKLMGAM